MTGGMNRQALAHGVWAAWPLALVWMAVLFVLSSNPGVSAPASLAFGDKAAHFAAYGALGFLLAQARLPGRTDGLSRVMLITVLVTVFGILTEWHQSTVPHRDASIGDVVADALGGFFAAGAVCVYRRRTQWQNG